MIRRALMLAGLSVGLATAAHANTAQDAADCAAFNYANWDYENKHFGEADEMWRAQARGFEAVAMREGMSAAQSVAHVGGARAPMLALIEAFVFGTDASAKLRFDAISETCMTLIDTDPAMSAFK